MADKKVCPKSDEGVRSAVRNGVCVVGLGKQAKPVAKLLREALGRHAPSADEEWEESRVNHLVLVVECTVAGVCCEEANAFMRAVRRSDGYGVYSEIIGRQVAILGLGQATRLTGPATVEEVLCKRGGCKRLLAPGRATGTEAADLASLPWVGDMRSALDTMYPEEAPPPAAPCPTISPEDAERKAWQEKMAARAKAARAVR